MEWKIILILSLSFFLCDLQTPQLKMTGERSDHSLPQALTEEETQKILKEQKAKKHVEATLKVSDERIASASRLITENQHQSAAHEVDLYAALIIYANAYTRRLPDNEIKDRSNCLKQIEQAIFKQTRTLDTLMRDFPHEYHQRAETKLSQVKQIRLQAINDLIGGGLVLKPSEE